MPIQYIPAPDSDFAAWLSNFATLLAANPTDYGSTSGVAATVTAAQADYQAAYLAATSPDTRTPATVAAKNTSRVNAEGIVRPLAVQISANAAVSDDLKRGIGVTVRTASRAPVPPPTTVPVLSLRSQSYNNATLDFRDSASPESRAKPPGVIGVQLFASFGTTAATDPAQLAFAMQPTRTPLMLDTTGKSGKVCSVAARYITRGSTRDGVALIGNFGAIVSFMVT